MEPVLISTNPLNQEEVGRVTIASADEIARVVANARKAQPAWAALSVAERKNLVERAYAQLDTAHDEIGVMPESDSIRVPTGDTVVLDSDKNHPYL